MKDLTVGPEGKLIRQFAMPMVYGNMFQQLYNVVDSIVIGHYIGKEALAAVGASFPIIFLIISLIIGLSMGFTIIISQYYGARNLEKVKQAIDTTYIILFFASIFATIVGTSFSNPIFRLTGLPDEVVPQAGLYLKIYFLGSVFSFGFSGISAILRGLGDSKTPLIFLIVSTITNVLLDLLFIVVFGLGIAGAAYATVISQAGAFFTAIIYLNKRLPIMNIRFRKYIFNIALFRTSLRIGLPTGLQQMFVAAGMIALLGIVNQFGTSTIAAYSVANRIDSFASMLSMNFAAALSSFVGQNIGANKPERIKAGLKATWLITSGISLLFSLLAILFGKNMMGFFTPDQEVINIGNDYLVIVGSFYILFSSMFTVNAVMRGAGDTLIPMFITLISLWIIRIPASYLLAGQIGVTGIWWAIPIGWSIGLSLTFIYYHSGKWRTKSLIKHTKHSV
ncbi:MAG TPA: MATE family efflux transporter [Bacteroidales bacterium]|nr:MATE family efflux transporter [Bacteroidales bacterium]